MEITLGRNVLPVHVPFHQSRARERINWGAVGSGKSYAVCDEAIKLCLAYPGISGLVTRKTAPELRDTTERVFQSRVPPELWAAGKLTRAGGHFERFLFPNGSEVIFRSIDDWNKHKSLNLGFICWDELSEFDEDTYLGMLSRLRQKDITPEARALGYTHKITDQWSFAATNPAGHDWVWRLFHPDSPERRQGVDVFYSTTLDNPYLPPSYVQSMLEMPEWYVKRFVLCQFDDFAGQIYAEWSWDRHVLAGAKRPIWTPTFRPVCWMGMDPGTENPTAAVWVWQDIENRRLVGIAEYQRAGVAVDTHVEAWRQIEARKNMMVRWRVADPNAITQRDRGTAISLQTQYAKLGYNFTLGASSPDARIPALAHLIHTNRFVVTEDCPQTFEAIKNYQWKDLTPAQKARGEDPAQEPLKKNTHLVECAQYLAGREVPQLKFDPRKHPKDFNEEIHRAIKKQLGRKAKARRRRRPGSGVIV